MRRKQQNKKFRFVGTCVELDGDVLMELMRTCRIMFEEDFYDDVALSPEFREMTRNDRVGFFTGKTPAGKSARWFTHSCIEYVFEDPEDPIDWDEERRALDET